LRLPGRSGRPPGNYSAGGKQRHYSLSQADEFLVRAGLEIGEKEQNRLHKMSARRHRVRPRIENRLTPRRLPVQMLAFLISFPVAQKGRPVQDPPSMASTGIARLLLAFVLIAGIFAGLQTAATKVESARSSRTASAALFEQQGIQQ
jgi:hypothetical protein